MSDYEHIVISAVRYALGRMTYIVELTTNYVIKDIDNNKLSEACLNVIKNDIKSTSDLGMACDIKCWIDLLNVIERNLKNVQA